MGDAPEIRTGGDCRGSLTPKASDPASRCSKTLKNQSALPRQIDGTATTRPPSSLSTDTLVVVTLDASWGVLPDPQCHVGFTLTPSVFPKARHVCFSQWGNAFWLCLDVLFHWQTAQWTALCLSSIKAANFRLVWVFFPFFFFPVLESVLNTVRERLKGARISRHRRRKCLLLPVMQAEPWNPQCWEGRGEESQSQND